MVHTSTYAWFEYTMTYRPDVLDSCQQLSECSEAGGCLLVRLGGVQGTIGMDNQTTAHAEQKEQW